MSRKSLTNPFRPGAGHAPPFLAGREQEKIDFRKILKQEVITDNLIVTGLRGVGKTVLLDRMRDDAEASGIHTVRIEAPERRSLPALLAPQLRLANCQFENIIVQRGARPNWAPLCE